MMNDDDERPCVDDELREAYAAGIKKGGAPNEARIERLRTVARRLRDQGTTCADHAEDPWRTAGCDACDDLSALDALKEGDLT